MKLIFSRIEFSLSVCPSTTVPVSLWGKLNSHPCSWLKVALGFSTLCKEWIKLLKLSSWSSDWGLSQLTKKKEKRKKTLGCAKLALQSGVVTRNIYIKTWITSSSDTLLSNLASINTRVHRFLPDWLNPFHLLLSKHQTMCPVCGRWDTCNGSQQFTYHSSLQAAPCCLKINNSKLWWWWKLISGLNINI